MKRIDYIKKDDVCPISALQADYNYLPEEMKRKIQVISKLEIDYLTELLLEVKKKDI
ncbi:hypothetical protein [Oceanobacillus kapialis]|uniref:hypothetical protein n=1 Tax=Oceanobacillus kapialis TaxID=481353 RepID=UPI00384E5E0D